MKNWENIDLNDVYDKKLIKPFPTYFFAADAEETSKEEKPEEKLTTNIASPLLSANQFDKKISAIEYGSGEKAGIQLLSQQTEDSKSLCIIAKDAKVSGHQKISADPEKSWRGSIYINASNSTTGGNQEITGGSLKLNVMDEFKKLTDIPEEFRQVAKEELIKQLKQ